MRDILPQQVYVQLRGIVDFDAEIKKLKKQVNGLGWFGMIRVLPMRPAVCAWSENRDHDLRYSEIFLLKSPCPQNTWLKPDRMPTHRLLFLSPLPGPRVFAVLLYLFPVVEWCVYSSAGRQDRASDLVTRKEGESRLHTGVRPPS